MIGSGLDQICSWFQVSVFSAAAGRERPVKSKKKLYSFVSAVLGMWERFLLASRCFLAG